MRVHKRKVLTKKYDKERISQEMMETPEELAVMMEDVKKAKRELQEISRARIKIRKPTKKTCKSRLVPMLNYSELNFDRSDYIISFTEFHFFVELCPESFFLISFYFKKYYFFISYINLMRFQV